MPERGGRLTKLVLGASPSNYSTLFCRGPESLSLLLDDFSVHCLTLSVPHMSPISSQTGEGAVTREDKK